MPYWEVVTRSFRIAWDHKYLWLIALFSGEGGGEGFNYSQRTTPSNARQADVSAAMQSAENWIGNHVALIVALGLLWLAIAIALFILAAVCEGATVRGSAEHDAGRPFGLGLAWRMGLHTMWPIVRFRLLLLLLNLPLLVLLGTWAIAVFIAVANRNGGAAGPLVLTGLPLLVLWLVYGTYLFFLDRWGTRAVILEERMAMSALARANGLLLKRLGRSLLVWLISIAVAIIVGIALACVAAVVFAPFFLLGAAITVGSGSSGPPVVLLVLAAIVLIPLSLLVGGFFSAQGSTYWTLAFRRLDVDYAPAYAYPTAPQAPPSPQG